MVMSHESSKETPNMISKITSTEDVFYIVHAWFDTAAASDRVLAKL